MNEHIDEFKKRNVELISISTDSRGHMKNFKEDYDLNMTLISDRGAKIGKKYQVDIFDKGAGKDIKFKQEIPSKYLINKNEEIVWTYIGDNKDDRPTMKDLIKAMDVNL